MLQVLNKYDESRRCCLLQDLPLMSQGVAASYGPSGVGGDSKTPMFQGHLVPFRAHQPGARFGFRWNLIDEIYGAELRQIDSTRQ